MSKKGQKIPSHFDSPEWNEILAHRPSEWDTDAEIKRIEKKYPIEERILRLRYLLNRYEKWREECRQADMESLNAGRTDYMDEAVLGETQWIDGIVQIELAISKNEKKLDAIRDRKQASGNEITRTQKKDRQVKQSETKYDKSANQDVWNGDLDDFKKIMRQLSISPNLFVSKESYKDVEAIFRGHFSDTNKPISGPRIDWRGTGPAFKYFHKLLLDEQKIDCRQCGRFFIDHFTCKGNVKNDVKDINDWCRDRRKDRDKPSKDQEKLEEIIF